MNSYPYKSMDPNDFTVIPLCILKDRYKKGERCSEIAVNNVVRSRKKHSAGAAWLFKEGGYVLTPYHFHEGVEILRINRGEAIVMVNGIKYHATEGDILIVNPFEDHGILLRDSDTRFDRTCLIFEPTNLFPAEKGRQKQLFNRLRSLRFQNYIPHDDPMSASLCACIDQIVEQARTREPEWSVVAFSQLVAFYAWIIKGDLLGKENDIMPYQYEFVLKVSEYVENHIAGEIRTEEVATYCGYSVGHFCRLFKTCFNRPFKEYLNSCRIEKAKEIMEGNQKVSEIYRAVGFRHANHFSNTFKKQEGISPTAYIKKAKELKGEEA